MQYEEKPFKPGYEKIVSPGRVWSERFNSNVLAFSLVPTRTLIILSGVMVLSALLVVAPLEKITQKVVGIASAPNTADVNKDSSDKGAPVVFGLSHSVKAVEQVSELKNDVAQAMVALETNNNLPFTTFPADLKRGHYESTKFSLKKVSEDTAFLAIPVGHFAKYLDESVQPAVTKYRLPDGSYVDAATPEAQKNRSDTLFFAALHKENGKWVAYNFKPKFSSFSPERIEGMPEVTQDMISRSFDAAFKPSQQ